MEEVKPLPQEIKSASDQTEAGKYARPSWDEYFSSLIEPLGRRGTCDRGRSGAVIVSSKHTIIATGYVGSPPGQPHCDEVGHLMRIVTYEDGHQQQHCVRTLHAEENAMLQCAKDGIKLEGSTIYSKMVPCWNCAMRIIRVGIKKVVAQKRYHADAQAVDLLKNAGVELVVLDNTNEHYANQ
jgi:dCMP deaminase